jgi:hypothetical protein
MWLKIQHTIQADEPNSLLAGGVRLQLVQDRVTDDKSKMARLTAAYIVNTLYV